MAKGSEALAYQLTFVEERVRILKKANEALSKRQRAKGTCIQKGGVLTIESIYNLIAKKATGGQQEGDKGGNRGPRQSGVATQRRCGNYGKAGHNSRTCQAIELSSNEEMSD